MSQGLTFLVGNYFSRFFTEHTCAETSFSMYTNIWAIILKYFVKLIKDLFVYKTAQKIKGQLVKCYHDIVRAEAEVFCDFDKLLKQVEQTSLIK